MVDFLDYSDSARRLMNSVGSVQMFRLGSTHGTVILIRPVSAG